jgi:SHS2 domain-containing protein
MMRAMPYRYVEDIAIADAAFEAWGTSLEDLFLAAADATMNVMVADLSSIVPRQQRGLELEADAIDLLLFQFLQEFIYFKDAEELLLRATTVDIHPQAEGFTLRGEACGERIDREKHELLVDIKAVTLHRFRVEQGRDGWRSFVILDI